MQRVLTWIGLLAIAFAGAASAASFKQEDKPQNLKAYFELMHQTLYAKKDPKGAAALFKAMVPDSARLKKALKDNGPPEAAQHISELHASMTIDEQTVTKLARAEQKEVRVHGAKTEEIAAYKEGSVAHRQFPGGTKRLAELALRPGMTFYEVEYVEPGKDTGMKYHLMYWAGRQWSMLGPVWRVLKR